MKKQFVFLVFSLLFALSSLQAGDLGLKLSVLPVQDNCLDRAPSIQIYAENYGTSTVFYPVVAWSINGEQQQLLASNGAADIPSNASLDINPFGLTALADGQYVVEFWIVSYDAIEEDENLNNNSVSFEFEINSSCENTKPQFELTNTAISDGCDTPISVYAGELQSTTDDDEYQIVYVEHRNNIVISINEDPVYNASSAGNELTVVSYKIDEESNVGLSEGSIFSQLGGCCTKIGNTETFEASMNPEWTIQYFCDDDEITFDIKTNFASLGTEVQVSGSLADLLGISSIADSVSLNVDVEPGIYELTSENTCLQTLEVRVPDCSQTLEGNYNLGPNGSFATLAEFQEVLDASIITGNLKIFVDPGNYSGSLHFESKANLDFIPTINFLAVNSLDPTPVVFDLGNLSFTSEFHLKVKNIEIEGSGENMVDLNDHQEETKLRFWATDCKFRLTDSEAQLCRADDLGSMRIYNCDFTGGNSYFNGESLHAIDFRGCNFQNYYSHAMDLRLEETAYLSNCHFFSNENPDAALIFSRVVEQMTIDQCSIYGNHFTGLDYQGRHLEYGGTITESAISAIGPCVKAHSGLGLRITTCNFLTRNYPYTLDVSATELVINNSIIANDTPDSGDYCYNARWRITSVPSTAAFQIKKNYSNFYATGSTDQSDSWNADPVFNSENDLHINGEELINAGDPQFLSTTDLDGDYRDNTPSIGLDQVASEGDCGAFVKLRFSNSDCPCEFNEYDLDYNDTEEYGVVVFELENDQIINHSYGANFNPGYSYDSFLAVSYKLSDGISFGENIASITDGNGLSIDDGACLAFSEDYPSNYGSYDDFSMSVVGLFCSNNPGFVNVMIVSSTNTGDCFSSSASIYIDGLGSYSVDPYNEQEEVTHIIEIPEFYAAGFAFDIDANVGGCDSRGSFSGGDITCQENPDCDATAGIVDNLYHTFCTNYDSSFVASALFQIEEDDFAYTYVLTNEAGVIIANNDQGEFSLFDASGSAWENGKYFVHGISYYETDGINFLDNAGLFEMTDNNDLTFEEGACFEFSGGERIFIYTQPKVQFVESFCDADGNYNFVIESTDGTPLNYNFQGFLTAALNEVDTTATSHTFILTPDPEDPSYFLRIRHKGVYGCSLDFNLSAPECIEQPQIDASVANLNEPTEVQEIGVVDFEIDVLNNGPETLTSVEVNWSIDGIEQIPYLLNDFNLPAGETVTLTIGSFMFEVEGEYNFAIWTSNPNGAEDANSGNDYYYGTVVVEESNDCEEFEFMTDILCAGDDQSYTIIFNPLEQYSSEYQVTDLANGESALYSAPFQVGPFLAGSGFNLEISAVDNPNCQFIYSMAIVDCATTEVALMSFDGIIGDRKNTLQWITASESETEAFIIEHSTDGIEFLSIASLPGAGFSNSNIAYQLDHEDPPATVNYYRLVEREFSGEEKVVSSVVALDNSRTSVEEHTGEGAVTIFPNPTIDYFEIAIDGQLFANPEAVKFKVVDASGRLVLEQQFDSSAPVIDCSNWTPGIYFLHWSEGLKSVKSKILKTH